jgi:hypothetical protein
MRATITRVGLVELFDSEASTRARSWLADAAERIVARPELLDIRFAAAARGCGRAALSDVWHCDTAARVLLLTDPAIWGPQSASRLYEHGTAEERRAVLLALDVADDADESLLALTRDALRGNDTRLITAALGTFAAGRLDPAAFRQAVLKCVFCGVPFEDIAGLANPVDGPSTCTDRADPELARMLAGFTRERIAAGRAVPDDVWPLLRRFPSVVADSGLLAEPSAADPVRAAAARHALNSYHPQDER